MGMQHGAGKSGASRVTLLLLLALLGHCDVRSCRRAGGAIPPATFTFHALPDGSGSQVACADITFYYLGSAPVSWHCPVEVAIARTHDAVTAQARAAEAADEAARHVMSLGRPESADAACSVFYTRMKSALADGLPASIGKLDACTKHRFPVRSYP